MELNIRDLDLDDEEYVNNFSYEDIPENVVVKKNITTNTNTNNTSQQISYDTILSKMGMFVSNGKLHLQEDKNIKVCQPQPQYQPQVSQNNYIYNKYFKEELQPEQNAKIPTTKEEYKMMLLEQLIQKERIRQIKSTKLIMPTSNINISGAGNTVHLASLQNKLFRFPKR